MMCRKILTLPFRKKKRPVFLREGDKSIRVETSCDRFAISDAFPMHRMYYNRRKPRTRTKRIFQFNYDLKNGITFVFLANEKTGTLNYGFFRL